MSERHLYIAAKLLVSAPNKDFSIRAKHVKIVTAFLRHAEATHNAFMYKKEATQSSNMQNTMRYLCWLGEKVPYGGALHVGIRGGFAGGFAGDSQGIRLLFKGIRFKTNALGLHFRGIRSRPLRPFYNIKKGKMLGAQRNRTCSKILIAHILKF